jgi:hypothetical protein
MKEEMNPRARGHFYYSARTNAVQAILEAKAKVQIQDEVSRRGGLGLKKCSAELVGPCPSCGGCDRFAVSPRKGVFLCRGCRASGDVISLVQFLDGVDIMTAVRTLDRGEPLDSVETRKIEPRAKADEDDRKNTDFALRLWGAALPITAGTVVEKYLHRRELHDLPGSDVIRMLHGCPYDGGRQVCLIALYRDIITNEPKAISRTAIDANGNKIGRMSLGPVGGCAVKIDPDEDVEQGLAVGEGLETCLAARQLGLKPCWSVGSAGAIRAFPVLSGIESLSVLVDHDLPDQRGREAGQEAALACSQRWVAAGREVRRIVPRRRDSDMADIVQNMGGRRHG